MATRNLDEAHIGHMPVANSPLRYPGGKAVLATFLGDVVAANGLQDGVYVEPYAGGAGAALSLLFAEQVQRVILNDADPCICAFWSAVLRRKDDLVRRIENTPVTIEEWKRQRAIYLHQERESRIRVAFATFYLNRCNRSGIIANGGPIGGFEQTGKWKLDARFNKEELIRRIDKIHLYRDRIQVSNLDAIEFLRDLARIEDCENDMLVYLDPPYYVKGSELYLNHYRPSDHSQLATFLSEEARVRWLMTYDDVPEIRKLYACFPCLSFEVDYSAYSRRKGREVLFHSTELEMPI